MIDLRTDCPADDRLNVLLTDGRQPWATQLPQLLQPQGVRAIRAECLAHAVEVLEQTPIHVAVVDLGLPADESAPSAEDQRFDPPRRLPGGMKLLQVMRRMERRPPAVVVVRGKRFDSRIDDFILAEAMRLNVFSVMDKPVALEQMLAVLQRALERFYGGTWPK